MGSVLQGHFICSTQQFFFNLKKMTIGHENFFRCACNEAMLHCMCTKKALSLIPHWIILMLQNPQLGRGIWFLYIKVVQCVLNVFFDTTLTKIPKRLSQSAIMFDLKWKIFSPLQVHISMINYPSELKKCKWFV